MQPTRELCLSPKPPQTRGAALGGAAASAHVRPQSDGTGVLASGSASERGMSFAGRLRRLSSWPSGSATRVPPSPILVPRPRDIGFGNAKAGPLMHHAKHLRLSIIVTDAADRPRGRESRRDKSC